MHPVKLANKSKESPFRLERMGCNISNNPPYKLDTVIATNTAL